MSSRTKFCGLAMALGLAAACGGSEPPPPAEPDAGSPPPVDTDAGPAPPDPVLVLGIGEHDLTPVSDGDVVPLSPGFQGLQHVWIALRVRDFEPDQPIVQLALERLSDAERVSSAFRARLPLDPMTDGDGVGRVGIQLVVPDPAAALGRDLRLSASIQNRSGSTASAEARVTTRWEDEL